MYLKAFFYVCVFALFCTNATAKTYSKKYYETGKLKSEGWVDNGKKSGYWKFYYMNGRISEEGHYDENKKIKYWHYYNEYGKLKQQGSYIDGQKSKWWLFFDTNGQINHKCQLSEGVKNGYCLKYINEKLSSAEKYENGKKINEWFSFSSFKSDNKLSDLK
ncbi:hypothetical protein H0I23_12030 [Cellulophaga sp. HaHaR_3_176]|uniref:toxin-antitoxin system YwqK family antitoxin n=1 Tax=Cellulophaga sp. HaHaR_3_176 TaxID=1942464 RepID=UPI001C1F3C52|nr:hypothetical protein [Cellulophaga sp. HaHaR_3_176]QWX83176.1 hypothetical protein H0I23_12030 [Cellulophaga sp. HaHaR_3_176]